MTAKPNYRVPAYCGAIVVLALAAGCVSLRKAPPQKHYYVLHADRSGTALPAPLSAVLKVRRFRVSRAFAGRGLVYRTGELAYESDFYNEFFASPDDLITDEVRRWLAQSAAFGHVVDSSHAVEARYALEGSVVALYGDYRKKDSPEAVLDMQLLLLNDAPALPRIVFEKAYGARAALEGTSPEALAKAWGRALAKILTDFEADLQGLDLEAGP